RNLLLISLAYRDYRDYVYLPVLCRIFRYHTREFVFDRDCDGQRAARTVPKLL
ncbi:hypothetical protein CSUI_006727, partial [Cystoisospora suis]